MSILSFLPMALGALGSLFGGQGKDTRYQPTLDPATAAAYKQLLALLQSRMGGTSAGVRPTNDALNLIYGQFFGKPFTGGGGPMTGMPTFTNPGGIGTAPWMKSRRVQ